VTDQTFMLSGSGILNLDTNTFTPVVFTGTEDPSYSTYIVDNAGDLLGIVGSDANFEETVTANPAEKDSQGHAVAASSVTVDSVGGAQFTTSNGAAFTAPSPWVVLPFCSESGGITTTASLFPLANTAIFDSASSVPDANWIIGVNANGDAVIQGTSGAGYNGTATLTQGEEQGIAPNQTNTPDITTVVLDQVTYALSVIPDSGETVTDGSVYGIVAEGTGTSNVTLGNGDAWWHVNGKNDQIALGFSGTSEFYFADPESDYKLAWNATKGTLTVTGGSTGSTVFTVGGDDEFGTGEITFGDGKVVGLGSNSQTGFEDAVMYGDISLLGDEFVLNGGTQTVYATSTEAVQFLTGSDNPADWAISEKTVGKVVETIFNGNDAGYDGIATISGATTVELNDEQYVLTSIAVGASPVSITSGDEGGNIVTDGGNATINFDQPYFTNYWFVGGASDAATLTEGTTEIYLTGALSAYTLSYNAAGNLLVTGGTTGTTFIALAGGTGELNFGDGSVIGLGDVGDTVEYGTGGGTTFNLNGGDTYTHGGPEGGNIAVLNGTTFVYNGTYLLGISEDSAGDAVINAAKLNYSGIATLANIQQVEIGYSYYDLLALPVAGGTKVTLSGLSTAGGIIAESTNGGNTVTFDENAYAYTNSSWQINGANDTAILAAATTDLVLAGPASAYTIGYNSAGNVTVTGGSVGTLTVAISGGTGELVFGDGTIVGLGQAVGAVNYGGAGNDTFAFYNSTPETVYGGGGSNTAVFDGVAFGSKFSLSETSAGTIVATGSDTGEFDSTATLNSIQNIKLGTSASSYDLLATPVAAGALTVATPTDGAAGSAVVESTANDALTLSSTKSTYLYAGKGSDTIALKGGIDTMYFAGPEANYTETFTSNVLTITNTGNKNGNGTQAFTLTPTAKIQLKAVFTGNNMVYYDGSGTDTVSFTGTGQSEWYAGAGTTTATLSAGTTDIYLAGPSTDYTETYNGTTSITVTNTGGKDGIGTKTLLLKGGSGELIFGSGSPIIFGKNGAVSKADLAQDAIPSSGSTSDAYEFSTDGMTIVDQGVAIGTSGNGQLDILGDVSSHDLWMQRSGSNLVVDVLGTTDKLTLKGWFASGGATPQIDAGTLKLDTQVATLVQAMATFSADHVGFNPQTTTDTTLTNSSFYGTLTTADKNSWHS
jgi:hypothetical protein